jgi:hypothetical protein
MDRLAKVRSELIADDGGGSDLEYPSLERVLVRIYDEDTDWTIVYLDDAWWIELKEDDDESVHDEHPA